MHFIKVSFSRTLALAAMIATPAFAANIDGLLVDLSGNDEHARAVARQMLPREGAASIPKLLVLLKNDNPNVWWAANAVLKDILNELHAPAYAKQRQSAAEQILAMLSPSESLAINDRVLRLLPIAVPNTKCDLTPLAALLGNADLREKAREALGEINTKEAAEVIAAALDAADPDFKVALLNTSVHMRDQALVTAARKLLADQTPAIRSAAARAVAWTGQIGLLPALGKVFANAEGDSAFAAADALLRLCDGIAQHGGNYESVIPVYREVLSKSDNAVIEATALVGLGTYGDETVIPEIIAAASGAHAADLQGPALQALEQQTGRAAANALLAAYSRADKDMQALLLQMFGRKKDATYLPALTAGLGAPDAALRNAAVIGLRDSGLPDAAKALSEYVGKAADAEKPAALDALRAMTDAFVSSGKADEAGKGYLALYRGAPAGDVKNAALEGIKRFPTPEAFDVLIKDLDINEIKGMSVKNLAGLHKALVDAKRDDDAKKAEGLLLAAIAPKGAASQLIDYAHATNSASQWAGRLGAITKWKIVGPFPFDMKAGFTGTNVGEPNVDLAAKYKTTTGEAGWKDQGGDPLNGLTDLSGPLGMQTGACAYALAKVNVPAATDILLRAGSDDGLRIWVDGKLVHENNVDRGFTLDSDEAKASLQAGDNLILVQITQGGGGWNFGVRLTTADGTPLNFTQP